MFYLEFYAVRRSSYEFMDSGRRGYCGLVFCCWVVYLFNEGSMLLRPVLGTEGRKKRREGGESHRERSAGGSSGAVVPRVTGGERVSKFWGRVRLYWDFFENSTDY